MTASRLGRILGLTFSLWACAARAERVVVLELTGDRGGRVRGQVEALLREDGQVELIPLARYKLEAARRGLRGGRAMTGEAVAELAPVLGIDAAVGGAVGATFLVRILDPAGQELWSKVLPLAHGALSEEIARKLATAIVVAARPKGREEAPPTPGPPPPVAVPPAPTAPAPVPAEAPPPPARVAEPERGSRPAVLTLRLGGATTWRGYCARPGVSSCAAYDQLASQGTVPPGETVQFSSIIPYQGAGLAVDFFPLAASEGAVRGLGVSALYSRSGSSSSVTVSTPTTQTQPKLVWAVDQWLQALAAYRLFFTFGPQHLSGYVGVRGGVAWRSFAVDPTAQVPLPGAQRLHGLVGLEGALPLSRVVRLEAAASWFPGALPGPKEREAYGGSASGVGWGAELGVAGEPWGPWGYSVRLRYTGYGDRFSGTGTLWSSGGVAEELYVTLAWSVTLRF